MNSRHLSRKKIFAQDPSKQVTHSVIFTKRRVLARYLGGMGELPRMVTDIYRLSSWVPASSQVSEEDDGTQIVMI